MITYQIIRSAGNESYMVATYSCDDGHTLVGESTFTCQSDTQWSSTTAPYCAGEYMSELTFIIIQVASLALLLATIGGSDMSLQYIFVNYICWYAPIRIYELWSVREVEAGSNIVHVAMTQVYNRAVMQQSTRYYIIYFHFAFYMYAFISTTGTVTILCTCPIMHNKLITYCCLHY